MFLKSIFTGVLITAILVSVLAATRLMNVPEEKDEEEFIELETVTMEPPPEPPMEEEREEEEVTETLPQAPIPKLDLLEDMSVETVSLPLTQASFNPELNIDPFEIDRAPADLPVVKTPPKPKAVPKVTKSPSRSKPSVTKKASPRPKPQPKAKPKPKITKPSPPAPKREVVKAYYSSGEVDSVPRALRQGSFTWPRRAKGTTGTVKLALEISTSGKVKVISVISSTDPNLISPAKRVATGSRYTSPKYRGRAVKMRFTKTYHLKKP